MVMRAGQVVETLNSADLAAQRVQADYTRSLMQAAVGFTRQPQAQVS
jgi:ABC-type dipeptide/oligopeptide/nickel transport system ATPase subunit